MKRNPIWRVTCRATLGLVCLMFVGKAYAIESFRPIPLPDDGHGSIARAAMQGVISNTIQQVVGSKMNGSGMNVPMVWINQEEIPVAATELPVPMGSEGEALGGATYPNGDRVVVGNISVQDIRWGSFWRMPAAGTWGSPAVLCQDAEQSWVAGAHFLGGAMGLGAAGSSFEGGRWIAVLHFVTPTEVVTVDLPIPPGSNAAALAVYGEGGPVWAVGWITDRQGRMRPVLWANSGQGWATFPSDFLPNGAQGQSNGVVTVDDEWKICGDAMRAGRSMGFAATVDIGGHEISHGFLPPLDGFANSSAESLSTDGGVTFGRSMNPGGPAAATGWIGGSPFPVLQLMHDGESVSRCDFFRVDDVSVVGRALVTPGGQPQACVFAPTRTHVPDRINAVLGTLTDTDSDGLITLWHNDNRNLGIRAARSGGMLKALVDLQFTPLFNPDAPASIQYDVIARAQGNQPGASGTLNVYVLDPVSLKWPLVGSFHLGNADTTCTGVFPSAGFVNTQSGAVHLWLEFIADGNRPTALVCNSAQLTYMDDPTRDGH